MFRVVIVLILLGSAVADAQTPENFAATIYDAPGNNALSASGSTATLTTSLGSVTINKFDSVTANKENGTNDTVHQAAIDFALKTVGNWTSV